MHTSVKSTNNGLCQEGFHLHYKLHKVISAFLMDGLPKMAPAYTTWNFHSGDPKRKKSKIFFSAISSTGI